jgi:hypothetical protein
MKQYIFKVQFFIYSFIIISCASLKHNIIPTYNKGGYKINSFKNDTNRNPDDIYIFGRVLDVVNKKPISNAQLTFGCLKTQTTSNGEYFFKGKESNNTNSYIESTSIGYRTIETEFLDFSNNNTINVDFFLIEDDRPLINCEGKN